LDKSPGEDCGRRFLVANWLKPTPHKFWKGQNGNAHEIQCQISVTRASRCRLGRRVDCASHASFPGKNGRMAFIFGSDIYSMNPDGDVKELTNLGPDGALPFSS